jgi:hypothetical protein
VIINGILLVRDEKPVTATSGQMPEPPAVDTRLLRPSLSTGDSATESPAAERPAAAGSTPASTPQLHEVRKPIER